MKFTELPVKVKQKFGFLQDQWVLRLEIINGRFCHSRLISPLIKLSIHYEIKCYSAIIQTGSVYAREFSLASLSLVNLRLYHHAFNQRSMVIPLAENVTDIC